MGGGGSSGVHAMDGQSGDGAREDETLGKGGRHPQSEALVTGGHPEDETLGKGGSDAHNDKNDDLGSVAGGNGSDAGGSLPSYAATDASGIEGDRNVADSPEDLRYEPLHLVDGDWDDQTPVEGKPGAWGIVCGNWGGHWHDQMLHEHMDFDLKSSAGTILLLQEAREELLEHLKQPGSDGIVKGDQGTHGDGGQGTSWEQRPTAQFWGFRGQDYEKSILICARTSVVKGMRLLLLRVRHDGTYKKKTFQVKTASARWR